MTVIERKLLICVAVVPVLFHLLYWLLGWADMLVPTRVSGQAMEDLLLALEPEAIRFRDLPTASVPYLCTIPALSIFALIAFRAGRQHSAKVAAAMIPAFALVVIAMQFAWVRDQQSMGFSDFLCPQIYMSSGFIMTWSSVGAALQIGALFVLTRSLIPRWIKMAALAGMVLFWAIVLLLWAAFQSVCF